MAGFKAYKNKILRYSARVDIVLSCHMNFESYPLDSQKCPFLVGSYDYPSKIVDCTSEFYYSVETQPILQYFINLETENNTYELFGHEYAMCGFNVVLKRTMAQNFFQVYLTPTLLVIVSWLSFIISPQIVPGRMGLLVTIFLVIVNIFLGVKSHSPQSRSSNAADVFLFMCLGEVFVAFVEYAIVLLRVQHQVKIDTSKAVADNEVSSRQQAQKSDVIKAWSVQAFQAETSNTFDRIALILFPISFIIMNIMYCFVYF